MTKGVKVDSDPGWRSPVARVLTALGAEATPHVRLSRAGQSDVFRIWRGAPSERESLILKMSDDVETMGREFRMSNLLLERVPVVSPRPLEWGETDGQAWILFEDLGLSDVRWSRDVDLAVADLMAAVHSVELGEQDDAASTVTTVPHGDDAFRQRVAAGVSHTPGVTILLEEVGQRSWSDLSSILGQAGTSSHGVAAVRRLFRKIESTDFGIGDGPQVLSHGDFHRGNVLWRPLTDAAVSFERASERQSSDPDRTPERTVRRLALIDWEYAHRDVMWFDLFQWLDATSPTQPLRRYVRRVEALQRYRSLSAAGQEMSEWSFLRAYILYAAVHLVWILLRVHEDLAANRFDSEQLRRQQGETTKGLLSLDRDLRAMVE